MNKTTQARIIKASAICGIRAVPKKTWSGSLYVARFYNKAGDTIGFDPSANLGHAVEMLSILGGTLTISNDESKCWVCLEKDYPENHSNACVYGSWASKPKNKTKNICNAILNCILTKAKK